MVQREAGSLGIPPLAYNMIETQWKDAFENRPFHTIGQIEKSYCMLAVVEVVNLTYYQCRWGIIEEVKPSNT